LLQAELAILVHMALLAEVFARVSFVDLIEVGLMSERGLEGCDTREEVGNLGGRGERDGRVVHGDGRSGDVLLQGLRVRRGEADGVACLEELDRGESGFVDVVHRVDRIDVVGRVFTQSEIKVEAEGCEDESQGGNPGV